MLYVQRDVEERILDMLFGAMETLTLGNPWSLETDVGPVIDAEARDGIEAYCAEMEARGRLLKRLDQTGEGLHVAPALIRVSGIEEMEREVFGPILHIARFDADEIDAVIDAVNARGYGLTFGLHTRIDARVQQVVDGIHVGNLYVNRNQIGAVVGSQPFGGEGLSGTGPKAGGPHYLPRFRKPAEAGVAVEEAQPTVQRSALKAALAELSTSEWSRRPDRIATLRATLRGGAAEAMSATAALDMGPIDLPGPTGESNRLTLVPRGVALCLGRDEDSLLAQAVQALGTGNAVLAVAPDASRMVSALMATSTPIVCVDGVLDSADLIALDIDVVAARHISGLRPALADRAGPILPLVTARIDPAAYVHERAVCTDTTAAGGNATLLANAG